MGGHGRPRMTLSTVRAQDGRFAVNSACEAVEGALAARPTYDRVMLNHYVTKSRAEYADKMARGSAMGNQARPCIPPPGAPCLGAPAALPAAVCGGCVTITQVVCMHAPSALTSGTPPEVPWPNCNPKPHPLCWRGRKPLSSTTSSRRRRRPSACGGAPAARRPRCRRSTTATEPVWNLAPWGLALHWGPALQAKSKLRAAACSGQHDK